MEGLWREALGVGISEAGQYIQPVKVIQITLLTALGRYKLSITPSIRYSGNELGGYLWQLRHAAALRVKRMAVVSMELSVMSIRLIDRKCQSGWTADYKSVSQLSTVNNMH